ncbi:MAG TPA: hypothetical protein DDZ89_21985 [Clostridiales bacterium]|nr:hypothetical protein [Clostridiales bacterium]
MNIIYIHIHDLGIYNQAYGYNVPTPNLVDFAKEGTLFRRNYCVNPTCSASRAALLTGKTAHQCGMTGLAHRGFSLNNPKKHMANFLKGFGYETVLCGVQHEVYPYDEWRTLGYDQYLNGNEDAKPFKGYMNKDIQNAEAVVEYITNRKKEKPLFLAFGMSGTHRKYIEVDMGIDPDYISVPHPIYDTKETRKDFAQFMTSAYVMDYCAGLVFDALKENGYQEDSFIFFTTDHGIAFPRMKCNLYDTGIHVSLMIQCPNNKLKGEAVDTLTSHLDIYPTVCDYANIAKPEWLMGTSLMPLLKKQTDRVRDEIFAEINYHAAYEPTRCIRTDRFKYIKYYGTHKKTVAPNCDNGYSKRFMVNEGDWFNEDHLKEGLFDLYLDPVERVNLIDHPDYREELHVMKDKLTRFMVQTEDPLLKGGIPLPEGAKTDKLYQIGPDYKAKISLIAAISSNYVIGMDEKIPWRIPGEQKRFKDLTMGKTIIMGRKTYESIGKPLPGRNTVVISRSKKYEYDHCVTVDSLYDALILAKDQEEVFIVGGGRVYQESLPFADRIYLTVIDKEYEGNVFFPKFDTVLFQKTYEQKMEADVNYTYYTFDRKNE